MLVDSLLRECFHFQEICDPAQRLRSRFDILHILLLFLCPALVLLSLLHSLFSCHHLTLDVALLHGVSQRPSVVLMSLTCATLHHHQAWWLHSTQHLPWQSHYKFLLKLQVHFIYLSTANCSQKEQQKQRIYII